MEFPTYTSPKKCTDSLHNSKEIFPMIVTSIREVLNNRPVFFVPPDATLEQAFDVMAVYRMGAVMVLDHGDLKGILTEKDVIRHVSQQGGFQVTTVASVMTRNVACIETRDSLIHALRVMKQGGFRHVPVLDLSQKVIGMVSEQDIADACSAGLDRNGSIAA